MNIVFGKELQEVVLHSPSMLNSSELRTSETTCALFCKAFSSERTIFHHRNECIVGQNFSKFVEFVFLYFIVGDCKNHCRIFKIFFCSVHNSPSALSCIGISGGNSFSFEQNHFPYLINTRIKISKKTDNTQKTNLVRRREKAITAIQPNKVPENHK
jgi:hypothetical protein